MAVAGLVDGDDDHSPPAVQRACLRVSWWSGVSTGERSRRVEAWCVGRRHALACPWRSPCALWRACARHWHVWAWCVPVNAVHEIVEAGVQHDQESERELEDMVVQW